MGEIRTPLPVKLFVGILTSLPEIVPQAEDRLAALFGPVDSRSEPVLFDRTHYYDEDHGKPDLPLFPQLFKADRAVRHRGHKDPNQRPGIGILLGSTRARRVRSTWIPDIWSNPKSFWHRPKTFITGS